MKVLRRLWIVFLVVITTPLILFEVIFYSVRWILTGKDFPETPLCIKIMIDYDDH